MEAINRSIAVIRPKAPFIKWANNWVGRGERTYTAEYFDNDCMVLLIPLMPIEPGQEHTAGKRYIDSMWDAIFIEKLRRWNANEYIWPEERTRKVFGEWFKVEFHRLVVDTLIPE